MPYSFIVTADVNNNSEDPSKKFSNYGGYEVKMLKEICQELLFLFQFDIKSSFQLLLFVSGFGLSLRFL